MQLANYKLDLLFLTVTLKMMMTKVEIQAKIC